MKRIHVVGCPRSGTTLALEALVNGFAIDGHALEERTFLTGMRKPDDSYAVFCSKKPGEHRYAPYLLEREPELWFVFLLRDPRDVVVSRHKRAPNHYWTTLAAWRRGAAMLRRMADHPRFIVLRYEDLTREPDNAQAMLAGRMTFLQQTAPFSEFFKTAKPSQQSVESLHGVRPIDVASIGNWRQHKARLAAQMQLHGSVAPEVIEFGFERDDAWLAELDGVEPDNGESFYPDFPPWWMRLRKRYKDLRQIGRYRRLKR